MRKHWLIADFNWRGGGVDGSEGAAVGGGIEELAERVEPVEDAERGVCFEEDFTAAAGDGEVVGFLEGLDFGEFWVVAVLRNYELGE